MMKNDEQKKSTHFFKWITKNGNENFETERIEMEFLFLFYVCVKKMANPEAVMRWQWFEKGGF